VKTIVILISGRGSNMQAIVEANLPVRIAAVISNRPDADGLRYAQTKDIPTKVIDHRAHTSRATFDTELMRAIDSDAPDLVVLAGFMRILTDDFVHHYAGRLINIHPSLLPAFPGLATHQRALEAGVKIHGCTVHFVTPEIDHGPIVAQAAVPVKFDDTHETLAARVLEQEHYIYPQAIRWFAQDQLTLSAGRVNVLGAETLKPALCFPGDSL
jgi:phosphoribosylglycinamide formyltransferase-1